MLFFSMIKSNIPKLSVIFKNQAKLLTCLSSAFWSLVDRASFLGSYIYGGDCMQRVLSVCCLQQQSAPHSGLFSRHSPKYNGSDFLWTCRTGGLFSANLDWPGLFLQYFAIDDRLSCVNAVS